MPRSAVQSWTQAKLYLLDGAAGPGERRCTHDDSPDQIVLARQATMTEAASKKHVLIIGGGFAGIAAAQALKRADVKITLIDRRNQIGRAHV